MERFNHAFERFLEILICHIKTDDEKSAIIPIGFNNHTGECKLKVNYAGFKEPYTLTIKNNEMITDDGVKVTINEYDPYRFKMNVICDHKIDDLDKFFIVLLITIIRSFFTNDFIYKKGWYENGAYYIDTAHLFLYANGTPVNRTVKNKYILEYNRYGIDKEFMCDKHIRPSDFYITYTNFDNSLPIRVIELHYFLLLIDRIGYWDKF